MKKLKIDMLDSNVYFFHGKKEWKAFQKYCKKHFGVSKKRLGMCPDDEEAGRCLRNSIWVADKSNPSGVLHELSHVVDELVEWFNAEKEDEFRAYLTEYIFFNILKYCGVLKNPLS